MLAAIKRLKKFYGFKLVAYYGDAEEAKLKSKAILVRALAFDAGDELEFKRKVVRDIVGGKWSPTYFCSCPCNVTTSCLEFLALFDRMLLCCFAADS